MGIVDTVHFTAPFTVSVVSTPSPASPVDADVLVHTDLSAVSAGTELLAYRGEMPSDIPADAVFAPHAAPFAYPCAYGYAAVGMVTAIGPAVTSLSTGDIVFAFREHSSLFVAPEDSLHKVPNHVCGLDAAFLPNAETAVSLAMDAALLPGEVVCVVGQGVVGLLLVAVLKRLHPFSTVVALDVDEERRRVAQEGANADAVLNPSAYGFAEAFKNAIGNESGADVSVDVSGASAGLETAIRVTRDHGRVVIGSWFGSKEVTLGCLGGRFHRSHMQLVASQVSHIPPMLAGRWTKERRFRLAWRLLAEIKPSTWISVHKVDVHQAPQAYRELSKKKHVQVVFEYGTCNS